LDRKVSEIDIFKKEDNQVIKSRQSVKKTIFIFNAVVIFIAILGLLAYIPGLRLVGSISYSYVPMAPSSAICFLLLSTALILYAFNFRQRGIKIFYLTLSAIVLIYGFIVFIEYIFRIGFTLENAIFGIIGNVNGIPIGIMSPFSGIMFFLSGIIMILLIFKVDNKKHSKVLGQLSGILGSILILISSTFAWSYLLRQPFLYNSKNIIPVALTSTIAFIFFGSALVATGKDYFPLSLFLGSSIRSRLFRIFIPLIVIIVLIQSLISEYIISLFTINDALVIAIMIICYVLIAGFTVFRFAFIIGNELDKENIKMKHLSYHDSLTGLYNRAYFDEELLRLDSIRQLPLGFIIGDLDNLKEANDTFGHSEGDKMLKEAAGLLKKVCRSEDIIARWGGDEFVILLPKTSITHSEEVVKRIKKEFEKAISVLPVSISLGNATKVAESQDIREIMEVAENSMYENKLKKKKSNSIPKVIK
jgi:diguanylate cyclase (GGDEF)-like protein